MKKIKNKKKKVVKKKYKSYYKPKSKQSTELVIRVEQPKFATTKDLEPIVDGGKYMIPKTWLSEKQILKIIQKTPEQHIHWKPGKGGGKFPHVTGTYMQKVLNFTFGWNNDFEIISSEEKYGQVIVLGKLTVKDDHGHSITKMQYGGADIKFFKGTQKPLDFRNDCKAAGTDAFKKCASALGIASDVYGKAEFKSEMGYEPQDPVVGPGEGYTPPKNKLKPGQVPGPDGDPTYLCSETGDPITDQEYEYSMKVYGKSLSREAQKNHKPIKK